MQAGLRSIAKHIAPFKPFIQLQAAEAQLTSLDTSCCQALTPWPAICLVTAEAGYQERLLSVLGTQISNARSSYTPLYLLNGSSFEPIGLSFLSVQNHASCYYYQCPEVSSVFLNVETSISTLLDSYIYEAQIEEEVRCSSHLSSKVRHQEQFCREVSH